MIQNIYPNNTLNLLSKNFNFNFKKMKLKNLKNLKIAVIGMGGSTWYRGNLQFFET